MSVSDFKWTTCTWASRPKGKPAGAGQMNFGELTEEPASSDCYVRDVTLQQLPTAYNNAQSRSAGGAN